jgi:putative heme iron utilization protein
MAKVERDPETFSPVAAARRVLRTAATAALATLSPDGSPFTSLVTVATTPAGEPILLISRLAVHTQNLARDRRAALLLVERGGEGGDPLAGARLTVKGTVGAPDADPILRRRFLARHPEAAGYAGFADFSFHRVAVEGGHLVAGFGRIVALSRPELLVDCAGATELIETEESAIAHMNGDHAEAVGLYATRLLHLAPGDWRMTGADPDGIDLTDGKQAARLPFPQPVTSASGLRAVLADLARQARASA